MRHYHRNTRLDGLLALLPNPLTRLDRADLFRDAEPPRLPVPALAAVPVPVAARPPAPARPPAGR